MKLVLFLPDFRKGGAQAMMINLANYWADHGHQVCLVAGTELGGYKDRLTDKVTVVCGKGNGALSGALPLAKTIRAFQPDAILSALYHANVIAAFVSFFFKGSTTRIVISERNFLSASLKELPWIKRILMTALVHVSYPLANKIIGISEGVCVDLEEKFSMPFEKVQTIYNPVVTADFYKNACDDAPHPWLKDKNIPVLIAAGRLVPQKDYPCMLDAFKKALAEKPCRLIILGQGYLENTLKQYADDIGVSDHVCFVGQVESPLSYMRYADAFVITSAWEGFGNVIVEALYCGLPVVSTDCPSGPAEILDQGKYGFLCPPGDRDSVASAILSVLSSNPFLPSLQKLRAENFSVESIAREYEGALKNDDNLAKKKNIQIVASKFPPEYSGPGVRIQKLYDTIAGELNLGTVRIYCNGIEHIKNENYKYHRYYVRRRTAYLFKKYHRYLQHIVPQKIIHTLSYHLETFWGLWDLKHLTSKNTAYMHIFGHSGATAAALKMAYWKKIPVMLELVNAEARPVQKFFAGKVCPTGDYKIVAISSSLARKAEMLGFPRDNIWNRPNPVDNEVFNYEPEKKSELRKTLGLFGADDKVLLYIAKFMPRKNQIFLPNVLALLPDDYKLVLAGPSVSSGPLARRDADYMRALKEKIAELGLEARIKIINEYVNSATYMKACDIYCIPAWDEGLGTPMLEALSCGMPVICSEEDAFKEWIEPGHNGETLALKADIWAQKIKYHIDMSSHERGAVISNDITGYVSMNKIAQDYVGIIRRLANNP